jgi:hypothetical protein
VIDAADSNIDVGFVELHVFLHLSLIGLFGAKKGYLHLENYDFQEVFLSEPNSNLTRKQCARCPSSNIDGFLYRDRFVPSLSCIGLIEAT